MKDNHVQHIRPVCVLVAALVAASCSTSELPTAPTPQPPARIFVTAHLRGRVLEEGQVPVAGAMVKVGGSSGGSAVTDAGGAFDIVVSQYINPQSRPLGFVSVNIEKAGYERSLSGASFESFGSPSGIADVSKDYRLYRIRTIAAGESMRIAITPDDPWCGLEGEWWCRVIRIRSMQAGTLIVEAITDNASDFGLVVSRDYKYPFTLTPRISVPVSAGQETSVDLLTVPFDWVDGGPVGSPKGVTLITSLLSEG